MSWKFSLYKAYAYKVYTGKLFLDIPWYPFGTLCVPLLITVNYTVYV